jgi:hypothetical protein
MQHVFYREFQNKTKMTEFIIDMKSDFVYTISWLAEMAELADAHGSGPCDSNVMRVQVPFSAFTIRNESVHKFRKKENRNRRLIVRLIPVFLILRYSQNARGTLICMHQNSADAPVACLTEFCFLR